MHVIIRNINRYLGKYISKSNRVSCMSARILILNGPNLNLLGTREPGMYGPQTLAEIEQACVARAKALGLVLQFRQSNHEGELVDWVQAAADEADGLIINAGAYTHTSVAIHDALRTLQTPIIEVHLSNIYQREPFRHHSYISPVARGVLCGFGAAGYVMALDAMAGWMTSESE